MKGDYFDMGCLLGKELDEGTNQKKLLALLMYSYTWQHYVNDYC